MCAGIEVYTATVRGAKSFLRLQEFADGWFAQFPLIPWYQ